MQTRKQIKTNGEKAKDVLGSFSVFFTVLFIFSLALAITLRYRRPFSLRVVYNLTHRHDEGTCRNPEVAAGL